MFRPLGFPHAKIFHRGRRVSGIRTLFVFYHPAPSRLPIANLFRQIDLSLLRRWGIQSHPANLRTPLRTGCRVPFGFLRRIPNRILRKCTFSFCSLLFIYFPCRSTVMPPISHKIYNQKSINTSSQSCFYDIARLFIRPILPSPPRKKRRITVAHGIQYRLSFLPAFLLGNTISNTAPFALYDVIFPPCIFTISFVSASPMPVFPFLPV